MDSANETRASFLEAIADAPDDDTPRLVFADWLMEQGDLRGELIHVQCELARLEDDGPRRQELEQQEAQLLRDHEAAWLDHPPPGPMVTFERGLLAMETARWGGPERRWTERQRGWIARVILLDFGDADLGRLAAGDAVRLVPVVEVEGGSVTDDGLAAVARLLGVRQLVLANLGVGHRGLAHLVRLPLLRALSLLRLQSDPASLERIGDLRQLQVLEVVRGAPLSEAARLGLSKLQKLRRLQLANVPVTDDDLEALADLDDLRSLDVSGSDVTDAGLYCLGRLDRFEELGLARTRLTDAALDAVAGLAHLRVLNASFPGLTDAGLASLWGSSGLRELDLSGTTISDSGLSPLADLRALRKLDLSRTRVTDEGVSQVLELRELRHLALLGTAVTDDGATRLAELRMLRSLDLRSTAVTEDAAAELQRALPSCRIEVGKDPLVPPRRPPMPGMPW